MKITVIGTGYVGLVTGACLAEMGNQVTCADTDAARVRVLTDGVVPFFESGLAEIVRRNQSGHRLTFSTDVGKASSEAAIVFIAVGTPSDIDGAADLRHVLAVADTIGAAMHERTVVAVKSTVPVGTVSAVKERITAALAARGAKAEFDVVANPEFLKEGSAVQDFMRPDRIVVGADSSWAEAKMLELYRPFVRNGHPVIMIDTRSAELTKYAANVMLASRIAMINEIARISAAVGADIMAIRRGIGADSRIGMQYLYPGLGFGGSCLPKDVRALSHTATRHGVAPQVLDGILASNDTQRRYLAELVKQHFDGQLEGRSFALWGLAFKANTDDIREAPALDLIDELVRHGAQVHAYDPEARANARLHFANNAGVRIHDDMYAALEGADALLVATEWGVFRSPDFDRVRAALKTPVIFDGRNLYEPEDLAPRGLHVIAVGRAARVRAGEIS